ncbi:MAG: DUF4258 domain-containing protein [Beijerinckiaceae bacterium]
MNKSQPWSPADATDAIRTLGRSRELAFSLTRHAKERLNERDLIISDVLYILRNGFVFEEADVSSDPKLFKYKMETRTPNSGNRVVRIVVIPCFNPHQIKVVTVMWADES